MKKLLPTIVVIIIFIGILFLTFIPRETCKTKEQFAIKKEVNFNEKVSYVKYCASYYGEKGDGKGIFAQYVYPKPRDFTRGIYLGGGSEIDLLKRFLTGMDGAPMPSFIDGIEKIAGSDKEKQRKLIWGLVYYVKSLEEKDVQISNSPKNAVVSTSSVSDGKPMETRCMASCVGKIRLQSLVEISAYGNWKEDETNPLYYLVKVEKVALPLYPQFGISPNVYYIPPRWVPKSYLRQMFGPGIDNAIEKYIYPLRKLLAVLQLFRTTQKIIFKYEIVEGPKIFESEIAAKKWEMFNDTIIGLKVSKDAKEKLNHISLQLEFMSFLIFKEIYAMKNKDFENVEICTNAQKKFFNEHLGKWILKFCNILQKFAQSDFYKNLSLLFQSFVNREILLINSVSN